MVFWIQLYFSWQILWCRLKTYIKNLVKLFWTPIYNEVYIFKDWYNLRFLKHFLLFRACLGSLNYLRQESALVQIIFSSWLENISRYTLGLVMVQYLSCILLRQVKTRLLIFNEYFTPSIFYLNKEYMYCHIFRFKMRNDLWSERKGVFVFRDKDYRN